MAIVTRYFSTSGAGAADGTTWADRAALFSAGNWSTVITGFDFSGSDSLECRIEGGLTYTCSQSFASAIFTNAPTRANPVFMRGCDSSGNLIEPSDAGWVSAEPEFSIATFPTITSSSAIRFSTVAEGFWRCIKFEMTGSPANTCFSGGTYDWVTLTITSSNASNSGFGFCELLTNSQIKITGNAFASGVLSPTKMDNVRIDGTAATSSGTRIGVNTASTGYNISRVTIVGCAGGGTFAATGATTRSSYYCGCTIVNSGAYGIICNSTASQTVAHTITNCYIANSGTYGIDANGSRTIAAGNRLRDNTSGNLTGFGNYPTDSNYTTDSDDATEFVDAGAGDYRIKNTASAVWGKGYGAGDQPASGGGSLMICGE